MAGTLVVEELQATQMNDGTDIITLDSIKMGIAKAWLAYDSVNDTGIIDSYNIDYVTEVATGKYEVYFLNEFGDANYCVVTGVTKSDTNDDNNVNIGVGYQSKHKAVDYVYIDVTYQSAQTFVNMPFYLAIFKSPE